MCSPPSLGPSPEALRAIYGTDADRRAFVRHMRHMTWCASIVIVGLGGMLGWLAWLVLA